MKRVITSLTIFLFGATLFAQTTFTLNVWQTPSATGVSNYPVWVKVIPFSGSAYSINGQTNSSGQFQFTDSAATAMGTQVISFTYDCNGSLVSDTTTLLHTGDTLMISCANTVNNTCGPGFNSSSSSGLNLNLTDSSNTWNIPSANYTFIWNYGDGTEDTTYTPGASVSHTYAQSGTYNVCLYMQVYDPVTQLVVCQSSVCKNFTVGNPSFNCGVNLQDSLDPNQPYTVIFSKANVQPKPAGSSEAYVIDFGDGTSQSFPGSSISHTYSGPGNYTAILSRYVMNSNGDTICSSSYQDTIVINQSAANCQANFGYSNNPGTMVMNFIDSSSISGGSVANVNYQWNFGDGGTSTQQNPTHAYSQGGNYTVCFWITALDSSGNVLCTDSVCKAVTVTGVSQANCQAYFNVSGTGGSQINFSNNSTANNFPTSSTIQYLWTFGDGDSATSLNTSHSYAQAGNYTVCLYQTVLDSNNNVLCTSDTCMNIQVGSTSNCTATIYALPDGGNSLKFLGAIFNSPVTPASRLYKWDFGDGSTSTAQSPLHTYSTAGSYQVCLDIYALDSLQDTICSASVCKTVQAGAALQNGPGCSAKLSVVPDSADPLGVTFVDSSSISFSGNEVIASYILQGNGRFWYYSGAGIPGNFSASTLYDAPGTYTACVYHVVTDTVTNQITCVSKDCKTVTIGTPFCKAEYIVDTANSYFGNVYIWNTSDPAYSDPAYSTSYSWDFGDGNGSNQPFPVHVYADPGMYQVCLSISSINTLGDTCSSTFCDSLGVDSLGNLIYKNSNTGFTLNVLNEEDIRLEENPLEEARVYPNPASDHLKVELPGELADVSWQLIDLKGSVIKTGSAKNQSELKLDVSLLTPGVYLLSLKSEELSPTYFKLLIDR